MNRLGLAFLALPLLAGCASGGPGTPTGPARAAGFPGFDTALYPGDEVARAWRQESPYRWIGYYLPAPCHRETSWAGKRATLEGMGWGIAILYVGQQAFADTTAPDTAGPILCSRTLLSAEQGQRDARDAADRAAREGFPDGSIVFLDVERMAAVPPQMLEYYRAWLRETMRDGRFRPGVYAHRANTAELYLVAQQTAQTAGRPPPSFWVAGGEGFSLQQAPGASGFTFADVWQGALDVDRAWAGTRLRIDENVAERPAPSAPDPS